LQLGIVEARCRTAITQQLACVLAVLTPFSPVLVALGNARAQFVAVQPCHAADPGEQTPVEAAITQDAARFVQPVAQLRVAQCRSRASIVQQPARSRLHPCVSCRWLLRLLGLLAALTLGNSCLNGVLHLTLQIAAKAVLLHLVAALPDDVCQLAVIQLAHIAGRAQILPRLAVDVAGVTCRRLLRLLGLLASLTLSRCRLHRIAHLVLQPPPQAVLLQQRPALPDRIDQLTVVQLAHVAAGAQILPRLAIDVAAVIGPLLLLRLLGLLLCLLLLLPGLISGSARKLAPNLIYPSCR
jgi:hypothetical protein